MWLIFQQEKPDDFVIATRVQHRLNELCKVAYQGVGSDWKKCVFSDPVLVRHIEPICILADPGKAMDVLNWQPTVNFEDTVRVMVEAQIERLKPLVDI